MPKRRSFRGGVHPLRAGGGGKRATRGESVRDFVAGTVTLPMGMHAGAPSAPCVSVGDRVKLGQVVGAPVGALGLPVHASVSGEVASVGPVASANDPAALAVTIQNDFRDAWTDLAPLGDVEKCPAAKIIPAIRAAGICGMGGAAFPTHAKLTVREGQSCDAILLNGAECETHLTCDHRLMIEDGGRVVDGLRAVMRALDVKRGLIAIEDNKSDAIEAMRRAAQGREGVEVVPLRTKYPQGSEKQLIEVVTGREVPAGKLPIDAHVIVLNVATAAAIADAVIDGRPLISRVVTVAGRVNRPANLRVRVGTSVGDLIAACGGPSLPDEDMGKVVLGGAMTGFPCATLAVPIAKATDGVIVFGEKEACVPDETPCIRCGRCADACPMGLNPYLLKHLCDVGDRARAWRAHVADCIACGCCSYICPARRRLTPTFRAMKRALSDEAKQARGEGR